MTGLMYMQSMRGSTGSIAWAAQYTIHMLALAQVADQAVRPTCPPAWRRRAVSRPSCMRLHVLCLHGVLTSYCVFA